jgi:hypothetical protein
VTLVPRVTGASGLTPAVSFVRGGFLEENEVLDVDRLDT